jgi:hypothetical protein
MGKYDPLASFLASQDTEEIRISFAEIERILEVPLPASKRYPAFWSNNPDNSRMTKAWIDAGWRTRDVDIPGEKVTFYRANGRASAAEVLDVRKFEARSAPQPVDLSRLSPVARNVLTVLARRSGRSLAEEAIEILNDTLNAGGAMPTREQFHIAMVELDAIIRAGTDYRPNQMRQMIHDLGGYTTAIRLVDRPHPTEGYTQLVLRGRKDLTVEALIADDRWSELFEPRVVATARNRLR